MASRYDVGLGMSCGPESFEECSWTILTFVFGHLQTWITEFAINKWARLQDGVCDDCNITRPMQNEYMKAVL
eukprot:SAG31_NODE_372_length_16598_cov_44.705982_6_plen_72_part_00